MAAGAAGMLYVGLYDPLAPGWTAPRDAAAYQCSWNTYNCAI